MATSFTQQALVEAPVETVWALLADPSRYPEWAGGAIEVTGIPDKIEKGSTFRQKSQGPLGTKPTTTFEVTDLEDMREIRLQCQTSGVYSRWMLTEARGQTFADLEIGIEPIGALSRAVGLTKTQRFIRELADDSLDGLKRVAAASAAD